MELTIKKPLIEKIIEDQLKITSFSEQAKNYYRKNINISDILSFVNQRDKFSLMNTVNNITRVPIGSGDEALNAFTLIIKNYALVAYTMAVKKLEEMEQSGNLITSEEKTNFLIDLRNINQPEYFEMIIADHFEDQITN